MKRESNELIQNLEAMNFSRNVLKKRNVGIIDDDISQNDIIQHYLKKSDHISMYSCYTTDNPLNAVVDFISRDFDLLIIDINLPNSNGFKIGELVRKLVPFETPIIYMSSDEDNMKKFYSYDHKNSYFLVKPFKLEEFTNAIMCFKEYL